MLDGFRDDDELDKGNEFLDEFRQRLNSQPLESIEDRKKDINRSQHVFLGTVLGVGLAGIVSWFILSPDYSKVSDTEIPVIRRPSSAIKIQPAEPGGMEILNQDKTVYDIVEKKDTGDVKVENLLPPPEEPKLPTVTAAEASQPISIPSSESEIVKEAEKIIAAEELKSSKQKANEKITKPQENIKEEVKVVVKDELKNTDISAISTTEINTPESKKVVEITIPAGSWQIQLISSPNKAAIEKAWKDLTKKYTVLKNLPHEIETADLGNKGTFYRLKAGSFEKRTEADKICNTIKSSGGSCLVKKK